MRRKQINHACNCKFIDTDIPVRNGLAYTPKDVLKMTENGIPVSSDNASDIFYDGDECKNYEPFLERQRGIDVADLWNYQQNLKKKLHNIKDSVIERYNSLNVNQ